MTTTYAPKYSLDGHVSIQRDPLRFSKQEIWENCTEPVSSTSYWIRSMRTDADNLISIAYADPMNGETLTATLTPDQIVAAFERSVRVGLTHCSGYQIEDLDHADACSSDLVLQIAIFGELVF
jgi:hypothetical protein